ncbi:MAG: c-type cytochrome [bacterium]
MSRKIKHPIFVAAVALAFSVSVHAGGDPVAGKAKSAACQGCHGADGNSPAPQFPTLAGQYADYMVHAMAQYKSGERKNAIMAGMVAALTEQDMKDLAAWFASQKGVHDISP